MKIKIEGYECEFNRIDNYYIGKVYVPEHHPMIGKNISGCVWVNGNELLLKHYEDTMGEIVRSLKVVILSIGGNR